MMKKTKYIVCVLLMLCLCISAKVSADFHFFEAAIPKIDIERLGEFTLTAYCSCEKCCGEWALNRPLDENGNEIVTTASGATAKANYTVAADTSVLPFGTKLRINGVTYEVQDRGGKIKNKRIDVYFSDHESALKFGKQKAEVFKICN